MSTAEYCVGTAATCGFAGLLYFLGPYLAAVLETIYDAILGQPHLALPVLAAAAGL